MGLVPRWSIVAGVVALGLIANGAVAQTTYPNVRFQGRLQEHAYYFDNDPYGSTTGPNSNFFTRRARLEARGQISEYVTVFIQPSFEGGRPLSATTSCTPVVVNSPLPDTVAVNCSINTNTGLRLRDAWIDVRLTRPEAKTSITVRMGQEKRPFGRYELTSSNNLPSIERGAGRGLIAAASNDLFLAHGFLAHDVGAHVEVASKLDATRTITVLGGVYNGRGESLNDNNNAKSFGARATVGITEKLNVGAAVFSHDGIVGSDSSFTNTAFGIDAQWGRPGDEGLYVVGDYMDGKDQTAAKNKIRGISIVGAYNIRFQSPTSWLYAVEPLFRFDLADPNTDVDDNRSTLITAGIGVYMSSRAQFRVAYERQDFQAGSAEDISGLRSALTVNF